MNHLGHFLLTNLLLDTLIESQPSRVISVSSKGHKKFHNVAGKINFSDLNANLHYDPGFAYAQSKLANICFMKELQRRVEDYEIKCVSLHPGVVRTNLGRYML